MIELVARAKYSHKNDEWELRHNRLHLISGDKTACGKSLNNMWIVVKAESEACVNCKDCLRVLNLKSLTEPLE